MTCTEKVLYILLFLQCLMPIYQKKGMMEMKKAISLLSVILAVILLFSACRSGGNTGGSGTMGNLREEETAQSKALHQSEVPQGFIGIYTVEDLINSGANVGGNYILMNDLDLSSVEDWESIKNTAIFDGNNYTISNLHSTQGGLFSEAGTVKNLNIKECSIDVYHSNSKVKYVGAIAGSCTFAQNCSASGKVKLALGTACGVTKEYAVGGLFGYQNPEKSSLISACTNDVDVLGSTNYGASASLNLFVGGIVGLGHTVKYCKNNASIELRGEEECDQVWDKSAAGGIVGGVYMQAGNISYSSNSGDVRTDYYGGGILGFCYEESSVLLIDSCYNTGNITGSTTRLGTETSAGGILGYIVHYKPIRETTESKIINCYNTGICQSADYCGAILGCKLEEDATQIRFCAYSNESGLNITGTSAMYADNKAMTLEEMKKLNNYPFDNREQSWKNGTGNYPYPVFKGE